MKFKNLYINGCSFTAGHDLINEHRWTDILSSKLDTKLFNKANNGQSFDSIYLNTISHLSELSHKDTLVVIGLTWTPRHGVLFNNSSFNISPAHIQRGRNYDEKGYKSNDLTTLTRKFAPIKLTYNDQEIKKEKSIFLKEYAENLDLVMDKFIDFHRSLVKYQDKETLLKNYRLKYLTQLIGLQGYLKDKGFTYRFIQFPYNLELYDFIDKTIIEQLDYNNIIKFHIGDPDLQHLQDKSAHPTFEHNKILVDRILKSL